MRDGTLVTTHLSPTWTMHNFGEKFGESPFWISRISVLRDCRIEAAKAVPEIILSSIFNPLSYQSRWFVKTLALSGLLFKAICNTTIVGRVVRTGHTAISYGLIIDRGWWCHDEFLVRQKIQKLKDKNVASPLNCVLCFKLHYIPPDLFWLFHR